MVASRSLTHDCQSGNSCGSFSLSALRWIFCSIWSHTSARVKSPGAPMSENHLSVMSDRLLSKETKPPAPAAVSRQSEHRRLGGAIEHLVPQPRSHGPARPPNAL